MTVQIWWATACSFLNLEIIDGPFLSVKDRGKNTVNGWEYTGHNQSTSYCLKWAHYYHFTHANIRMIDHTSVFINVLSSSEIFLSFIRMDFSCSCTLFCNMIISVPDFEFSLGVWWVSVCMLLSKIFSPFGSWYNLIVWTVKRGRNLYASAHLN